MKLTRSQVAAFNLISVGKKNLSGKIIVIFLLSEDQGNTTQSEDQPSVKMTKMEGDGKEIELTSEQESLLALQTVSHASTSVPLEEIVENNI